MEKDLKGLNARADEMTKEPSQSQQIPEGRIKVRNPQGHVGHMDKAQYDKAISEGQKYELVQ